MIDNKKRRRREKKIEIRATKRTREDEKREERGKYQKESRTQKDMHAN